MAKAILGKKLRMTRLFLENGQQIPLTAVEVGPCPIVQIKTEKKEGYNALQIGFQSVKEKNQTKPRLGHFEKAEIDPCRILREIRVDSTEEYKVGQVLDTTGFEEGDRIDVTAKSKGHGFQGGMKRHNWGGGRKTHGSMFHRAIGAVSAGTGQGRIFKGKNLPGHMGHVNKTIQNIEIVKIDRENNILYIRGGLPGPNGGVVFIKQTTKNQFNKAKESK
jgi:large subunit ribosomal protein L3